MTLSGHCAPADCTKLPVKVEGIPFNADVVVAVKMPFVLSMVKL